MKKFFEHINEQDYAVRRKWLVLLCTVAGLIVVGVWVLTLRGMRDELTADSEKAKGAAQAASSLQSLGQKISASWKTLKEGIGSTIVQFQDITSSTVATTTQSTSSNETK